MNAPTCAMCKKPIPEGQSWEYEKGAYPIGTPEGDKRRVHSACVAQLIRETLAAFASVPEDKREAVTFEI